MLKKKKLRIALQIAEQKRLKELAEGASAAVPVVVTPDPVLDEETEQEDSEMEQDSDDKKDKKESDDSEKPKRPYNKSNKK